MGYGPRFFCFWHMYKIGINPGKIPYGSGNDFGGEMRDNYAMEEMMKHLETIGLPAEERERVRARYRDDPEGLRRYVLYMRAAYDDRHEYLD